MPSFSLTVKLPVQATRTFSWVKCQVPCFALLVPAKTPCLVWQHSDTYAKKGGAKMATRSGSGEGFSGLGFARNAIPKQATVPIQAKADTLHSQNRETACSNSILGKAEQKCPVYLCRRARRQSCWCQRETRPCGVLGGRFTLATLNVP